MKKIFAGIVIPCLLGIFTVSAFFQRGYFPMHDDTQIARVIVMGKALKQGQFPVRWISDLGYGYGYPIFNFYAPLPYYFGGILSAAGVDNILATKIMFAAGALLAGISMYMFLIQAYGVSGAVFGAVVFMYAPYHAVQMYIRGSVGEYWSIAFLPFIFAGFLGILRHARKSAGVVVGAFGLAGAILSHTILGFLTVIVTLITAGVTVLYLIVKGNRTYAVSAAFRMMLLIVAGLGLSAFFWIPAFTEMKFTSVSTMIQNAPTGFFDHFLCMSQLWNSPWGYAGSAPGCLNDGMSFKIGKVHILFLCIAIAGICVRRLHDRKFRISRIFITGLVMTVFSVVGTLDVSRVVWSHFPFVSFIQYPWRLLSFSMAGIAISAGYLGQILPTKSSRVTGIVLGIIVCIIVNGKLFQPKYTYPADSTSFETGEDLQYRVSKISDEYLPPGSPRPQRYQDASGKPYDSAVGADISILKRTDTHTILSVRSENGGSFRFRTVYFPGWTYTVNTKKFQPQFTDNLPTILVPAGKSIIDVRFTNTQSRNIGNIVSITAFLLVGGYIYYVAKNYA